MSNNRPDGLPYTQDATSPSLARGSEITKTGSPLRIARSRPTGSVNTATAPAAAACSQNSAPWCLLPGSAAYRSPGWTAAESCVIPISPRSLCRKEESSPGDRRPSSAASPVNERTGTERGRRAAGTGRDYLTSGHRERDVCDMTAVRCDLHRGQRELHHSVEDRARDLDPEIAPLTRILNVDRDDQTVLARRRRDPDETRAVGVVLLLGGAGLGRDRVAADNSPGLTATPVDQRDLLERRQQFPGGLGPDYAVRGRLRSGHVPAGTGGVPGHERRSDPHAAVRDRRVDAGHLHGGDVDALAERDLVPLVAVVAGPLRVGPQQARRLPRQVEPGVPAKPEGTKLGVLLGLGDVLGDLHHAVVE